MLVIVMVMVMVVRRTSYLLPLTSYPKKKKKSQRTVSTVVEVVVVSDFNPQNWLAGWLHSESRAEQGRIGQGRTWQMMQMMNVSTETNQPIHRLASLPRKSYRAGW